MKEKIIEGLSGLGLLCMIAYGIHAWHGWIEKNQQNINNFMDAETTCIHEIEARYNGPWQSYKEEVKECVMRSFKPLQ